MPLRGRDVRSVEMQCSGSPGRALSSQTLAQEAYTYSGIPAIRQLFIVFSCRRRGHLVLGEAR